MIAAIRLFNHADETDKKELAKRISTAAKKFNVKINEKSPIKKYLDSSLKEEVLVESVGLLNSGHTIIHFTNENFETYQNRIPDLIPYKFNEETDSGAVIVTEDNECIGYIIGDKQTHHITKIYIEPIYRRQGYGSILVESAINSLELNKVRVSKENTFAIKLFKTNDFNIYNETDIAYFFKSNNFQEDVELEKDVNKLIIDSRIDEFIKDNQFKSEFIELSNSIIGTNEYAVAGIADVSKPAFKTYKPMFLYDGFDEYPTTWFEEDTIEVHDIDPSIRRINRYHKTDKFGVRYIDFDPNEEDDLVKYEYARKLINDDIFVTSDLHLNHEERASLALVSTVINQINQRVPIDGTLLILGDIGDKRKIDQREFIANFIQKLNVSKKILILGNHDNLSLEEYYAMGFIYVGVKIETPKYIFTHCPVPSKKKINIHGHIHFEKEYWNMDPDDHIDVYYQAHKNILKVSEYLKLYEKGYYKGKRVAKNFNKKEKESEE